MGTWWKNKMNCWKILIFFLSQWWKCCIKKFKVYVIFLSWKLLKLSLQTRFKGFFQKEIPSVPIKITFHIFHFTNRNGMNQSFSCTYGPIYHGTIFFYFFEKYLKKFFVLPALLSNEKNSFYHHNSYNNGPNLAFFSFMESPSNSLLTIKFLKNHITSSYHRNLSKIEKAIFGHQGALGVEFSL